MTRRVNLKRWEHVGPGFYRTRDGLGAINRVGPADWSGHVAGEYMGNAATAVIASHFVERALDVAEAERTKAAMVTPYGRTLRFTRTTDRKVFVVTFYSHWTDIRSEDGETDTVKWCYDEEYVSASKGHTYTRSKVP